MPIVRRIAPALPSLVALLLAVFILIHVVTPRPDIGHDGRTLESASLLR
jgi:hypothetical protein